MALISKRLSAFLTAILATACLWVAGPSYAVEFADVVEQLKPGIVGIGSYQSSRRPPSQLFGTGFAIADKTAVGTLIVTNDHVVRDKFDAANNEQLVVFIGTGPRPKIIKATVIARDSQHDLAVMRIEEPITTLSLAESDSVREGQIYAFTGYPLGAVLGLYPVTHRGMISSITPLAIPSGSAQALSSQKIARLRAPMMAYQLDATAYPGNSGSPLYNMQTGAVVGVLNQVLVKSTKEDALSHPSGISYVIPIRHLKGLLKRLD